MLTATGPVGQTHWTDSTTNNASPPTNSADVQLKQELGAIFKKIGDKQTSTIGLYDLYHITKSYPKVVDMALNFNSLFLLFFSITLTIGAILNVIANSFQCL